VTVVLRRLIAVVALVAGLGVTVGTASAAADTPSSAISSSAAAGTSSNLRSIGSLGGGATALGCCQDWWW
jgi:hypothetical protein